MNKRKQVQMFQLKIGKTQSKIKQVDSKEDFVFNSKFTCSSSIVFAIDMNWIWITSNQKDYPTCRLTIFVWTLKVSLNYLLCLLHLQQNLLPNQRCFKVGNIIVTSSHTLLLATLKIVCNISPIHTILINLEL